MEPLISVITVAYNASSTIGRTIDSVDRQTYTGYEHLVVDGASTDGTQEIVDSSRSLRRRWISEPDKGIYDAMNKGLVNARGKYVLFLNAGDKFHSESVLQAVAEAIEQNDFPGVVYGQTDIVDNDGRFLRRRHLTAPEKLTLQSFADGMVVCHQAFVVLKRIVDFYDLKYRFSADYEWCIRCLQHSRKNVGLTDMVFVDYLEEGITTANHKASLRERFNIMCHYYGTFPTMLRHVRFLFRRISRGGKQ